MWPAGTEIECICEPDEWLYPHLMPPEIPAKGIVYTVRNTFRDRDGSGYVRLNEIMMYSFDIEAFRPVQKKKTDISVFTALLKKFDVKEPA